MTDIKPELLVVLGSGSSVGVGGPSTYDITRYIEKQFGGPGYPVADMNLIWTGLKRIIPNSNDINFEHVIAALEELQSMATSQAAQSDRYIRIAGAFTELTNQFKGLSNWQVLRDIRCRINELIKQYIMTHEPDKHEKKNLYENFFHELSNTFRLIVLSLNYVDYLDYYPFNNLCFNDGFVDQEGDLKNLRCNSFNHNKFSEVIHSSNKNVLMHVHGSLNYGYTPAHRGGREIVRRYGISSSIGVNPSDGSSNGVLLPSEVIISGVNKIEKLLHKAVPYGAYITAFISKLVTCPKLLLIGYGANDHYLNVWLEQHKNMHNVSDRRVSVVNKFTIHDFAPPDNSPLKAKVTFLQRLTEYEGLPSQYAVNLYEKSSWITPQKDLQLICPGFPCDEDKTKEVINYLAKQEQN